MTTKKPLDKKIFFENIDVREPREILVLEDVQEAVKDLQEEIIEEMNDEDEDLTINEIAENDVRKEILNKIKSKFGTLADEEMGK